MGVGLDGKGMGLKWEIDNRYLVPSVILWLLFLRTVVGPSQSVSAITHTFTMLSTVFTSIGW